MVLPGLNGLITSEVCLGDNFVWLTGDMVLPLKFGNFIPYFTRLVMRIGHDTVCAGVVGTAIRHSTSCAGLNHNFTKSKGNLPFRRLVPLFVSIGVCVTTPDYGTASDVTIGMWRHNQQATNHERNGKPWFSFPICKWWYAVEWMLIRKYIQVMPWI